MSRRAKWKMRSETGAADTPALHLGRVVDVPSGAFGFV